MLETSIKNQVVDLFTSLKNQYSFQIKVANSHPNKKELIDLLDDVANCSDKLQVEIEEEKGLSFTIFKNGKATNVTFKAVPNGHEFTSLLLAILNLDGIGKNLPDETLSQRIKNINKKVEVKSYISLSCTNCPDVVQALNIMAFLNPNISHEIIDGAINKEEVDQLNIQAVPSVYANGEQLHVGRSSLGELLAKIENLVGVEPLSVKKENKEYDVIVAGGGPAGVSAAIYSARKGFSVAIVAEKIGGQVTETVDIENMISIPKTTGSKLSANLMEHLGDYPIDILENRLVKEVEVVDGIKKITTSLGENFTTPALIIATGASWRKLNIPGESEYIGAGVAFCTHCDGPFYKGKKVVVIGGGNSGLEAAIDLSSIATEVKVLEFMPEVKGDQVLQDKIKELKNISITTNAQSLRIEGDDSKVNAIVFRDRESGNEESIQTDGVFVQIGLTANSQAFANAVKTNKIGEIEIDSHCRTNQAGIYAAGDVSIVPYKQIVIAMGEGSKAALSAFDDKIKGLQLAN
ncbi:alkyl hydroperoxide reductase subunit F [Labilibaculum sp.]|uniref:alkyl hydroperoxide reductase subunit F n=1 Tax=Labilibaculum sp. TaxID=2060723 RepID=UPI0035636708